MTARRVLVAALVTVLVPVGVARAWFTDTATVTTGQLAAHTMVAPASMTCTAGTVSSSMTVTVPHADGRYTYVARIYRESTGALIGGDRPLIRSGSTSSLTLSSADTELITLLTEYRIRVWAHLPGTDWWSSAHREWRFRTTGTPILSLFSCLAQIV